MLYYFYEWNHAALTPLRAVADATRLFYQNPLNPISHTEAGRTIAAMAELFERTTRVYGKPQFDIHETFLDGQRVPVQDRVVWEKPFARLLHFDRELPKRHRKDPRFLIVAPMSGHYATLLRGTVEALLPYADVAITDWTDARKVPLTEGRFDLDDYVDYLIEMLEFLGPDTHVIGVCQPAVPVMMAVARMEADGNDCSPATMTLMGGPIDTRINPTAVNRLAQEKGIGWFRENVIMKVPFPQPGFMRDVYPGFLQLTGFMSMNLDRHMLAHKEFFWHLVKDDGDSADKHREFYDEYNAVMDLTAEFYLQTVEEVFIKHSLPKGTMTHRGKPIDLTKIKRTALLTIEGENDDISGVGQTEAAQRLCTSIPDDRRVHYVQPKVGHYGVFNGSRYRAEIAPRIVDFALTHGVSHAGAGKREAAEPGKGGGPKREGAVEAREAKAGELGKSTSAGGETGLAGVSAMTPAAFLKAVAAPVETLLTPADPSAAAQPATAKDAGPVAKPADRETRAAAAGVAEARVTGPAAKDVAATKPAAPAAKAAETKPAAPAAKAAETKPAAPAAKAAEKKAAAPAAKNVEAPATAPASKSEAAVAKADAPKGAAPAAKAAETKPAAPAAKNVEAPATAPASKSEAVTKVDAPKGAAPAAKATETKSAAPAAKNVDTPATASASKSEAAVAKADAPKPAAPAAPAAKALEAKPSGEPEPAGKPGRTQQRRRGQKPSRQATRRERRGRS